jgi:hypothetical protein
VVVCIHNSFSDMLIFAMRNWGSHFWGTEQLPDFAEILRHLFDSGVFCRHRHYLRQRRWFSKSATYSSLDEVPMNILAIFYQ